MIILVTAYAIDLKKCILFYEIKGKIKRDLSAVEQQSDDALSVFGRNIPRLLKRIEEEYKKKRFKEKPRGPIGV